MSKGIWGTFCTILMLLYDKLKKNSNEKLKQIKSKKLQKKITEENIKLIVFKVQSPLISHGIYGQSM